MASLMISKGNAKGNARKGKGKGIKLSSIRRVALTIGGTGIAGLLVSLSHCAESIGYLTGSPSYLSWLMALVIDAGLVSSELTELATADNDRLAGKVKLYSRLYVIGAVLLSMLLNVLSFSRHAPQGSVWASYILGVALPLFTYLAFQQTGRLWKGK